MMAEQQQFLELMQAVTAAMVGLLAGLITGIALTLLMLSVLGLITWNRRDRIVQRKKTP